MFIRGIRQDFFQMLEIPLIRLFGSSVALASLPAIELFGSIELRPVPTAFRESCISAILCHDVFGREAFNAAIKEGEEADFLN